MLTLQDSISGNGFLARITMSGRTLMRKEDDGKWWMYGVRPAAIAASGDNIDEAFRQFRAAYWGVLADMAEESSTFDEFESSSPEQSPSFIRVERVDAEAKDTRLTPSENVPDVYAYSLPKAA